MTQSDRKIKRAQQREKQGIREQHMGVDCPRHISSSAASSPANPLQMKRLSQGCLAAAQSAATSAPGGLLICIRFAGDDAADDDIIDIYPSGAA